MPPSPSIPELCVECQLLNLPECHLWTYISREYRLALLTAELQAVDDPHQILEYLEQQVEFDIKALKIYLNQEAARRRCLAFLRMSP